MRIQTSSIPAFLFTIPTGSCDMTPVLLSCYPSCIAFNDIIAKFKRQSNTTLLSLCCFDRTESSRDCRGYISGDFPSNWTAAKNHGGLLRRVRLLQLWRERDQLPCKERPHEEGVLPEHKPLQPRRTRTKNGRKTEEYWTKQEFEGEESIPCEEAKSARKLKFDLRVNEAGERTTLCSS